MTSRLVRRLFHTSPMFILDVEGELIGHYTYTHPEYIELDDDNFEDIFWLIAQHHNLSERTILVNNWTLRQQGTDRRYVFNFDDAEMPLFENPSD